MSQGMRDYTTPPLLFFNKSVHLQDMKSVYLESEASKLRLCGLAGQPFPDEFCRVALRNDPIPGINPAVVVWPRTVRDVQSTMLFVRKHRLCLCVAGAGHEYLGRHSSEAHCLMVRTGLLRNITWELSKHNKFGHLDGVVRLGAGNKFEDVHAASESQDRVVVSGHAGSVGVVGWFLGGGHGQLAPWKGIGVDNIVEVELVAADGGIVTANAVETSVRSWEHDISTKSNNTDLFWALRGGGGSAWGIITAITFKVHSPGPGGFTRVMLVYKGSPSSEGWDALSRVLDAYRRWLILLRNDTRWTGSYFDLNPPTLVSDWTVKLRFVFRGPPSAAELQASIQELERGAGVPSERVMDFRPTWFETTLIQDHSNEGINPIPSAHDSFFRLRAEVLLSRDVLTRDDQVPSTLVDLIRKGYEKGIALVFQFQDSWHEGPPKGQEPKDTAVSFGMRNALASMLVAVAPESLVTEKLDLFVADEVLPRFDRLGNNSYFSESPFDMPNWKERYWDALDVVKLERIKRVWDPELIFSCHHCIGEGMIPICPNQETMPPRRPGDCILDRQHPFPGDRQYVEGTVFPLTVSKEIVASLLPDGLEPAPVPGRREDGLHPVLATFCTQFHVGSPFTDFTYLEFILGVPYVQWDESHRAKYTNYRGPFSYLPHLYLNATLPVILGQHYIGDNKELARISQNLSADGSGSFIVTGSADHQFAGEVILEANWTTRGPYWNAESEFPKLSLAGYDLPSIGRYPKDDEEATWHCLPQDYFIDTAIVAPVAGTFTVHRSFEKGVPTGSHHIEALLPDGTGGYRIKTQWDYTNLPLHPLSTDCKRIKPSLARTALAMFV